MIGNKLLRTFYARSQTYKVLNISTVDSLWISPRWD